MTEKVLTFQDMILALERYWAGQGGTVMQPYDSEVGAGTFHTAPPLRALGPGAGRPRAAGLGPRPRGPNTRRCAPFFPQKPKNPPGPLSRPGAIAIA